MMTLTAQPHSIWRGESPLTCISRREETHDTATFELAAPDRLPIAFLPGQFISICALIDGKSHWRAYSISSSPTHPQTVSITVRRVDGGLVSNWLVDELRPGMEFPALPPAGEFALDHDDVPPAVALFSAGCGITPVMSMTRWLLERRADVDIHFFHSARNEENFIFAGELLELAAAHPRLKLHLFLSRPLGRLPCHAGRIDAARLRSLLPAHAGLQAYLCGTEAYMDDVAAWLGDAGLAEAAIHRESFTPALADSGDSDARFSLSVPEFGKEAEIAGDELLLDVLEREGLPIIGACRTGICGSCKCKVVDGEVETTSAVPLTPEEVAAGYVLACSTKARSPLSLQLG